MNLREISWNSLNAFRCYDSLYTSISGDIHADKTNSLIVPLKDRSVGLYVIRNMLEKQKTIHATT